MSYELTESAELAVKFVNSTNRHVFLTGKAGSGKTTLLHHIIQNTHKNAAVAAPTGIAAINAGGVTLHSLLHLPFGTFIPENTGLNPEQHFSQVNTPQSFLSQFRMAGTKRNLIRNLDLLIIDEVSMLRADMLDCIDLVLRTARRNQAPFGGLQILFIGDLNQLPPVVRNDEWQKLKSYYKSAFFFEARVLQQNPLVFIALDKIYRQSDPKFLEILNRLRQAQLSEADIAALNAHYDQDYQKKELEGYIHITTHNRKADKINEESLHKLKGTRRSYRAIIGREFPENMFPISDNLGLKVGAQVMFMKNDTSGDGRYFNGKIGEIHELNSDTITVKINDPDDLITVERYKWENKRYKLNPESNQIDEHTIGSFEQFPLKLAWAITVHKSQGLTFTKAILDVSDSFAPGQMYVALSRLTGLEGLILSTLIPNTKQENDLALRDFEQSKPKNEDLSEQFITDRKAYIFNLVRSTFNMQKLIYAFSDHIKEFNSNENRSNKQKHLEWTKEQQSKVIELNEIGRKFAQSTFKIEQSTAYLNELTERVLKANGYFIPYLEELEKQFHNHADKVSIQKKIKGYMSDLNDIIDLIRTEINKIAKTTLFLEASSVNKILQKQDVFKTASPTRSKKEKISKPKKRPTAEISLELYKAGKTIEEIAETRGFIPSTITGHLCNFLATGEVKIDALIDTIKLEQIGIVIQKKGSESLSEIKNALGDEFTYVDVKIALAHFKHIKEKES